MDEIEDCVHGHGKVSQSIRASCFIMSLSFLLTVTNLEVSSVNTWSCSQASSDIWLKRKEEEERRKEKK